MRFILLSCLFSWLFLAVSCQENSQERIPDSQVKDALESKYKDLEEFNWLSDVAKIYEEDYQSKFKKHFEQSLNENNFENAAAYLIAYGSAHRLTSRFDSIYVETVLNFHEERKNEISKEAQSHLFHYLGVNYHGKNDLETSSYWHKRCLEFEPESNTHKQIQGFTHFSLAQNNLKLREFDKTEEHLVAALEIFEEVGDLRNQGTVYLLMHNLYVQNRAYDRAEKILNNAIDIFKIDENEFLLFSSQIMKVHFHIEQGDTLETINQIDELSNISKKYTTMNEYHRGILNQFLTFKFIAKKEQDSAFHYLNLSKTISEETGIPDLKMRTFFQEILYSNTFKVPLEDPEEVERFYHEMAKSSSPNTQFMYQMASVLYDFYQKGKDYKKANEYAIFLVEDTNKQFKDRLKNQLFELEMKFQTERKEKTILIQEKTLAKKNQLIIYLIGSLVLIVLISLFIVLWTKNKAIMKEKKLTENFASQLLRKTEDERKRIAADLHDSVSNELVNLRHAIQSESGQLKNKIDFILEEVRSISRNISPTLFDKIGLKSSIEQLTERARNQHDFFISSEIDYEGSLDTDKELQLYRIVQEAITNILKHAEAVAGKITISEDNKFVHVEIKDNGKGFDVEKMLEKGNCFGLLNITERTKYLKGTVDYKSDSDGTVIRISIPK